MCGGKDDEMIALDAHSGNVPENSKCGRPTKTVLMILNVIIWIGCCALLGLGIFGLVDNNLTLGVMDGYLVHLVASVMIIIGSVGFIISFIGCCGALTKNKCLIMTYVVVLGILLGLMLIGLVLGFFFSNRLESMAQDKMIIALEKYDRDEPDSHIVRSWDSIQRVLKCCGVLNYEDWKKNNQEFGGFDAVPKSCCIPKSDGQISSGCVNANNLDLIYTDGCKDKIISRLGDGTPIAAGISALVSFLMIIGMILGIVVYSRL